MSDQPNQSGSGAAPPSDPYGELIDHEYDGIHEYDNPTPGWWHMIFLCSVLFAIPYALFFHWSPIGWSVHDSYQAEMDSYNKKVFGKFGDMTPDADTVAGLMGNPEYMDAMRGTFVTKCASCHLASGAGMVGPNLTDNVYKNITKIDDIYHVITNGVTAAGMPAWGRQLSKTEIILMSAYVASLRDTNAPGGKGPEGDAIGPWPVVEPIVFEVDSEKAAQ